MEKLTRVYIVKGYCVGVTDEESPLEWEVCVCFDFATAGALADRLRSIAKRVFGDYEKAYKDAVKRIHEQSKGLSLETHVCMFAEQVPDFGHYVEMFQNEASIEVPIDSDVGFDYLEFDFCEAPVFALGSDGTPVRTSPLKPE